MLILRALGGLSLSGPGIVPGRATQRRRLALLARLAVGRGQPVSRDSLAALLWADANDERARHLLADSLYVVRDALGADVVIISGGDVALNRALVTSDVIDFAESLEEGDHARAVQIYAASGPFLDGVHVPDAPEFERWVDSVRARLASDFRRALEHLARTASERGDRAAAIDRWRQLTAADPVSSRIALELMRELALAGDRAGALEFARVHHAVVRAELEAAPDPAIAALETELRTAEPAPALPEQRAKSNGLASIPPEEAQHPTTESYNKLHAPAPARATLRQRLLAASALVVSGVTVYVLAAALGARSGSGARSPSIAILPLSNLSADSADDRLVDGITEGLIATIATTGQLRVIASTSSFAFKGRHTDVRRIADSLHVDNVVEGSFQRSGQHIQLTIRLIDATDGATTWSQVYQRNMGDVFQLEREIGLAVAHALDVHLLSRAELPSPTPEAFDLYLRGGDQRLLRSDSGAHVAVGLYAGAVASDPGFAAAWAGLARSYATVCHGGEPLKVRIGSCDSATIAARRAIAIDSTLADGYVELAYARLSVLDFRGAGSAATHALALDPNNDEAHDYLAAVDQWFGRSDEALSEARKGLDLDPLSVGAIAEVARALFYAKREDEALALLQPLRSLRPPVRRVRMLVAKIYQHKRLWSQAIAELGGPVPSKEDSRPDVLGRILAESGQTAEANGILAALSTQLIHGGGNAFAVASVYVGLHDYDRAFPLMEQAIDDRSFRPDIADPTFEEFRADKRFAHIRERLGLNKPSRP